VLSRHPWPEFFLTLRLPEIALRARKPGALKYFTSPCQSRPMENRNKCPKAGIDDLNWPPCDSHTQVKYGLRFKTSILNIIFEPI